MAVVLGLQWRRSLCEELGAEGFWGRFWVNSGVFARSGRSTRKAREFWVWVCEPVVVLGWKFWFCSPLLLSGVSEVKGSKDGSSATNGRAWRGWEGPSLRPQGLGGGRKSLGVR